MFLGHLAVGLASKRAAPKTSLGTLVLAAYFLDLIWPIFLLMGLESVKIDPGNTAVTPLDFVHYPLSHSLLASMGWAIVIALIYRARTGYARGALWVGIGVVSHWVLDFVAHRADLQIVPGNPMRVGLGLWHSKPATIAVESLMMIAALAIYLSTTRARNRTGSIAFWAFITVMAILYAANLAGPPPPNVRALAIVATAIWLFIPWAYWIDRNRELRP